MKLYISSDMEGSTGIVSADQVTRGTDSYAFGCKMQLHDALAVARAAHDLGVGHILLNDAHGSMTNIDASALPDYVHLVSGTPKILGMVEGVNDCDLAFFIGYHAMAGTEKAILDHTFNGKTVYSLKINGQFVGETAFNAMLCASLGVPVGLVSGDVSVCYEASSFLGSNLTVCPVKDACGRYAAKLLPPELTAWHLADAVATALKVAKEGKSPKVSPVSPFEAELTFHTTAQADGASLVPGSERISGRALVYKTEDIFEVRRFLSAAIDIACSM